MAVLTEEIKKKWDEVVNAEAAPKIKDNYRRAALTTILENTEEVIIQEYRSNGAMSLLAETTNQTGGIDIVDPVLIALVRRAIPNLMAFDVGGVQPMGGPTGLIFAIRSLYGSQRQGPHGSPGDARTGHTTGGNNRENWARDGYAPNEAFYNEADTDFSGTGTHNPGYPSYEVGTGYGTPTGETMGRGESGDATWQEMSFTIEKASVEAKTRGLRAQYTNELAQDLKAVHGLDAENELANILATEIVAEINREVIGTIRRIAKLGQAEKRYDPSTGNVLVDSNNNALTSATGIFDLEANSDGRWQAEKFKALLFKINKEANAIAKDTRRGRGNFIIVSSDVAAALDLAGKIDYAPAVDNNLYADDTGNTFVGVLQGRFKVYVDPYLTYDEVLVGYKGPNPYDAGMFYCPYVPLQMVKAVSSNTYQPSLAFKTRYGIVANPFTNLNTHGNSYYRKFRVINL